MWPPAKSRMRSLHWDANMKTEMIVIMAKTTTNETTIQANPGRALVQNDFFISGCNMMLIYSFEQITTNLE